MEIVFTGADFYRVGDLRDGNKVNECVLANGAVRIWDSLTPGLLRVIVDCGDDYTVTICDRVSFGTPDNGRTCLSMWRDNHLAGMIFGKYGH